MRFAIFGVHPLVRNELKHLLEKASLEEIQRFTDWRLYVDDQKKSSALEGFSFAGGDVIKNPGSDQGRAWILYEHLPEQLREFCDHLMGVCRESGRPWRCFNVDFTDKTNYVRFRVQEMGTFFACKQILTAPPNLKDMVGVSIAVRTLIESPILGETGGLVLMVGDTGTGKTMFATAAMRSRLSKFGGYCLVLADPPEQPIGDAGGNRVGANGYVDVVDVSEIGYTKGLTHSLRSFPVGKSGSLFYGEIRSDSNAFDLINASCDGHVVFSTMHAMSPDAALERLISWCARGGVKEEIVRSMLAKSLFGIVFHRMAHGLFKTNSYEASESVKSNIRTGHPLPFQESRKISMGN